MTVYADGVALLNFLVDLFLMVGTNRLSGFPTCLPRLLLGSGLGAVYSGLCLARPGLGSLPLRLLILAFMCLIAFGSHAGSLRRGAVFLLLSLALGGLAMGIRQARFSLLTLEAALLAALCHLAFGERIGGREYVPVTLSYGGRTVRLTALRDTGNSLRDPITGRTVLVISPGCGERLTGLSPEALSDPVAVMTAGSLKGARLIPGTTAAGRSLLLAFRPDRLEVDGRESSSLVAFSRERIGEGQVYQALTGGIL